MAPDLVARYGKLQAALKRLCAIRAEGIPLRSFKKDPDTQAKVERYFQVAIEALIDVGNHLCARRALEKPESGAQVFEILGSNGLLSRRLAGKLANWARFRNILVHGYAEIDLDIEHRALMHGLDELRQGAAAMARHLKTDLIGTAAARNPSRPKL